jgi:hypothetical protein
VLSDREGQYRNNEGMNDGELQGYETCLSLHEQRQYAHLCITIEEEIAKEREGPRGLGMSKSHIHRSVSPMPTRGQTCASPRAKVSDPGRDHVASACEVGDAGGHGVSRAG